MKQIILFVTNINVCYLVLNILLILRTFLYLKQKNIKTLKRRILLFCVIGILIAIFPYFNNIFQNVFSLKYLSVKGYLIVLAITNIITLITINKKIKLIYTILNYTLFILMFMIFLVVLFVIISNKIPQIYFMNIQNVVVLVDLSLVIFLIYFILCMFINNLYYIFLNYKFKFNFKLKKEKLKKDKIKQKNKVVDVNLKKDIILSEEELLNYKDKNNFYINEVECSIIFEDSNTDNIIKNYHILLENIDAPLVNGFTLKENKLLKSICTKLDIYNLSDINIYNLSILNKISVEEYNFLKNLNIN